MYRHRVDDLCTQVGKVVRTEQFAEEQMGSKAGDKSVPGDCVKGMEAGVKRRPEDGVKGARKSGMEGAWKRRGGGVERRGFSRAAQGRNHAASAAVVVFETLRNEGPR